jgi:hypothetical protein
MDDDIKMYFTGSGMLYMDWINLARVRHYFNALLNTVLEIPVS